jgi:replicative DNA helicase
MRSITEIKTLLPVLKKCLEERGETPKFPLNTLPDFNRKIWGLRPGLCSIGGRTSQGKTALALQIAWDYASQGFPVVYFSLEMTANTLLERLFCMSKRVDNFKLLCGGLKTDLEILNKWTEFEKEVPKNLFLVEGIGFDFKELNNAIDLFFPAPKIVIVDYIQSIRSAFDERLEINEYVRQYRALALKRDFVGIMVSQMNRMATTNENKRPGLENFKSSGVLEEHSDLAILLHWDYFYSKDESKKNNYEIILAKNNAGRTGTHEVVYKPEFYLFTEIGEETKNEDMEKTRTIFDGTYVRED